MKIRKDENKRSARNGTITLSLVTALISLTICCYSLVLTKRNKIACIDTTRVLRAFKGVQDLTSILEERAKVNQLKSDTLMNEFQMAMRLFEKKRSSFNKKELEEEENKLRQKQQEYTQFNAAGQENLKQEELKIIESALKTINTKISNYAIKEGYEIVFGSRPDGEIVHAGKYTDLTDEIIKVVNE